MSDLHCPARILLLRQPANHTLAQALTVERIAASYDGPVDLDEVADRHRGETVLVVGEHTFGPGEVMVVEIDADGTRATQWGSSG